MKNAIGLVVAGLIAGGCGVDQVDEAELGDTSQAIGRCNDPDHCTVNNGGGVYTDENGFAGVGTSNTMITTFINAIPTGGTIPTSIDEVIGRGQNIYGFWDQVHPSLKYATVNGGSTPYKVAGITEVNTLVTIWLYDENGLDPIHPSPSRTVELVFGDAPNQIALQIAPAIFDSGLYQYALRWSPGGQFVPAQAKPYCFQAKDDSSAPDFSAPDTVVFQQSVYVDPVTGVVTRNRLATTMSCTLGAIAQSKAWGYGYTASSDLSLFASALQMKRAAYCGDAKFFTRKHTLIDILDYQGINKATITSNNVEALWGDDGSGRIRALCVDSGFNPAGSPNHLRRPGALWPFPVTATSKPFAAVCDDGNGGTFTIPSCTAWNGQGTGKIMDAPHTLSP